jgi:hypothetical protein
MYAVKDEASRLIGQSNDTLEAKQIGTELLDQPVQPRIERYPVDFARRPAPLDVSPRKVGIGA